MYEPERNLDLVISSTNKTITVADGTMKTCHGVVKNIPVTFGELKAKIDFLGVDRVPVGVLLKIPEAERLDAHIDLGGQYADFTIGRKSV